MIAPPRFTLAALDPGALAQFDTVIDARSPAEFVEDRVPGAINLPALDDAERARVGTIYVQQSRFEARRLGAGLLAANVARHLAGPLADKPADWKPLVYCWRGGQRSGGIATIFAQIGWRVMVLDGGYRAYRRSVAGMLHQQPLPHRLVVLDGNTGTAKTDFLARLAALGVQVIDLEALANHRGSVFGARGVQPSQKHFESNLAAALSAADPVRPLVIEAESSRIGQRILPPSLWNAMITAPRVRLEAPLAARAAYLVRAYGDVIADQARLDQILTDLVPLVGHARIAQWRALAADMDFVPLAAALMQQHYDPRYANSAGRFTENVRTTLRLDDLEPAALDAAAPALADAIARIAPG